MRRWRLRDADNAADSDERLVAAVRRGDDHAFELLYQRYQRRIHAYVVGMVKDHGRAEDVTQEVFVSALRGMRESEQPLAFKPWIYQIAKNGCIDAFRRSSRAEEVSYDADDVLTGADQFVGGGPSPDAAIAAKQDLDNLCGAFGGLSDTHHEILLLRELEGLSYREIGKRMGMSRPAVESTLFRARRRLTEEYDDIVSGARCLRITQIIGAAVESRLGARDARRLARHLSHCDPCRREALAAGLDRRLFSRPSVRERVAGLLPFPAFLRLRRDADAAATTSSPQPGRWSSHLPMLSDQLSSGWGKAAAGAAVLVAGVGGAAGVHQVTAASAPPARVQPATISAAAASSTTNAPKAPVLTRDTGSANSDTKRPAAKRSRAERTSKPRSSGGSSSPAAVVRATSGGGGPVQTGSGSNPSKPAAEVRRGDGGGVNAKTPASPSGTSVSTRPAADVKPVTDAVDNTADQTGNTARDVTQQTTQTVDDTVKTVAGAGPAADAVDHATDTVDQAVNTATDTVDTATDTVDDAVGDVTSGLGG